MRNRVHELEAQAYGGYFTEAVPGQWGGSGEFPALFYVSHGH